MFLFQELRTSFYFTNFHILGVLEHLKKSLDNLTVLNSVLGFNNLTIYF
jgi:hypothetical protein